MSDLVIGDYTAAVTVDGSTNYLLIQPGSSSTAYKKINRNVLLGVTGQPADISTVQSFTNKTLDNTNTVTLKDTLFTLQDDGDTTKQAKFQLSGITTATTRTYTLPNASSTLADIATAQTFTNKTLTSPAITGGTIDNSTITVDAIGEHTAANGVTIDGMNVKDGKLNTSNSVVTSNITDTAVTPAKLQAGTGSGWSYNSWTPTFTNLTVGNGSLAARYIQIGKSVFYHIEFQFGTTSSMGTGPQFTLPVTSVSTYGVSVSVLGNVAFFHAADSSIIHGDAFYTDTTHATISTLGAAGTYTNYVATTASVPFVWATSDKVNITGSYEAA